MDTRGRGMSAQNPDHSPERLVEDITSFVKSIGKPVGLLGWGSCHWVPTAAQNIAAIAAVAAYDPGVDEVMGEEVAARFMDVVERMGEAVAEDRLTDAAEILVDGCPIYTPEEVAEGVPSAFWRAAARTFRI